jgi:hypothetical protein
MGAVYLAHDPQFNRPVALKVPRLTGTQADARFLREDRVQPPGRVRAAGPVPDRSVGDQPTVMPGVPVATDVPVRSIGDAAPVAPAAAVAGRRGD